MSKSGKLYYKISEISEITQVEEYKLRYWESKIPILKPKRIQGNQRLYTQKEIKLIQKIRLYLEKGVKLEAVSSYLLGKRKQVLYLGDQPKNKNLKTEKQHASPATGSKSTITGTMDEIRVELQKIIQRIDEHYAKK